MYNYEEKYYNKQERTVVPVSVNKYQMFLKTVECGSFSKAAAEMSFTQSAVSHAAQALENELNITLLSRNRGGVVLTADGRALLPRIE